MQLRTLWLATAFVGAAGAAQAQPFQGLYIGAGAGYGWTSVDNGNDKNGFTYSLMAGVSVDLSESVALDAGYRYRDIIDAGDDHSVLGGIRFKF